MKSQVLLACCALVALPASALGHITFADPEVASGAYYAGFLRVSHGCGASDTRSIRVEIPAHIVIARPQPKPGWRLQVERARLPAPAQSEAGPVTERVAAVTWTGRLPADQFDHFGLMVKLPAHSGPLYFPVVQTCTNGARRWDDIPAPGAAWSSVESPAPVLNFPIEDSVVSHMPRE